MLLEFTVGNFRSFLAPVVFSMRAAKLRASDKTLNANNLFKAGNLEVLRSAAIYGANASGKSNLVKAMRFARQFVLDSSKESQAGEPIGVERFRLSTVARKAPAHFQLVFGLDGRRYRYGFEVDDRRVRSEWLYRTVKRESRLFVREGDQYDISGEFSEGRGLEDRVRDNALLLSVAAQFNGTISTALLRWFGGGFNVISGLQDVSFAGFTLGQFKVDEAFRQRVLAFVRQADLGISGISVETHDLARAEAPKQLMLLVDSVTENRQLGLQVTQVKTRHRVFDEGRKPVDWVTFGLNEQESEGTQKIFHLSGLLLDTLDHGKLLVIDEMEARLHPKITRAVISLFNSPQTNPRNAQLVFATHDTGLLTNRLFRRDQIWFTEKDECGATDLYSLAELKVRNDASYGKDYIAGKYGAVPFIGGLRSLFEEEPDGETAQTERA